MNWLSLIGTGWAYKRYRDAINRYNEAVAYKEAQQMIIQQWIDERDAAYDEALGQDQNSNKPIANVQVGFILNKYTGQMQIQIHNGSEYDYRIYSVNITRLELAGYEAYLSETAYKEDFLLTPGQKTVTIKTGYQMQGRDGQAALNAIVSAAKGNGSTTTGLINIANAVKASFMIEFVPNSGAGGKKEARWLNVKGVLQA